MWLALLRYKSQHTDESHCSLPLVPRPGPDGRWLDKDIGRYAKQSDRDTNTSGKHCHNSFPRLITRLEINIGNNKHYFIPNHGDKHRITAASEESLHQINRGGGCELGVNIYAPSKYRRVKLPTHSWGYFGLNISKMTIICLRSDISDSALNCRTVTSLSRKLCLRDYVWTLSGPNVCPFLPWVWMKE